MKSWFQCYIFLDDAQAVADILEKLLKGTEVRGYTGVTKRLQKVNQTVKGYKGQNVKIIILRHTVLNHALIEKTLPYIFIRFEVLMHVYGEFYNKVIFSQFIYM